MHSLGKIKAELTSYTPNVKSSGHDAAVALILREQFNQTELLLIERSIIPKDPWSGQLAFPGGRVVKEDKDLLPECAGLEILQTEHGSIGHLRICTTRNRCHYGLQTGRPIRRARKKMKKATRSSPTNGRQIIRLPWSERPK